MLTYSYGSNTLPLSLLHCSFDCEISESCVVDGCTSIILVFVPKQNKKNIMNVV